jgi:hypothetical protein
VRFPITRKILEGIMTNEYKGFSPYYDEWRKEDETHFNYIKNKISDQQNDIYEDIYSESIFIGMGRQRSVFKYHIENLVNNNEVIEKIGKEKMDYIKHHLLMLLELN